jgi:septation ring formation regulator EzrA
MAEKTDLQRIGDAVVSLARAEEKLSSIDITVKSTLSKLEAIEERVRVVEQETHDNTNTVMLVNKVFWTILTTIITAGIGTLFFLIR